MTPKTYGQCSVVLYLYDYELNWGKCEEESGEHKTNIRQESVTNVCKMTPKLGQTLLSAQCTIFTIFDAIKVSWKIKDHVLQKKKAHWDTNVYKKWGFDMLTSLDWDKIEFSSIFRLTGQSPILIPGPLKNVLKKCFMQILTMII